MAGAIKEDIIDAVNDLKAKDFWQLDGQQQAACDNIIKKMVLSAKERDHAGYVYDLTRDFFDVLRSVLKANGQRTERRDAEFTGLKQE